jgi:hypothetical protein
MERNRKGVNQKGTPYVVLFSSSFYKADRAAEDAEKTHVDRLRVSPQLCLCEVTDLFSSALSRGSVGSA